MSSSLSESGGSSEALENAVATSFGDTQDSFTENVESGQQEAAQSTSTDGETGNPNPAWQPVIDALPEGFHGLVTPALKEWDRKVNEGYRQRAEEIKAAQEQLERFQPYSPFVEKGFTPDQLNAAQMLVQELANDPQAFYNRLGEHFGFAMQQAAEQAEEEVYDANQQQIDPAIAAQMQQLQQQQQQIAEFVQQQQAAEQRKQADVEIDTELKALEAKYNISDLDKKEIFQRAILMGQNGPVTLEQAYRSWDATKRELYAQRNTTPAPGIISTSGSSPVTPPKPIHEMSDKEFKADTVAMLRALNQS